MHLVGPLLFFLQEWLFIKEPTKFEMSRKKKYFYHRREIFQYIFYFSIL